MEYENTHYFSLPKLTGRMRYFQVIGGFTSPSSTSAQSDFPKVAVIGGSLGGLFAAIALRSVNCDVEVFEKSPANMKSRGAGIVMQMEIVNFLRAQYCPESVPKYTCLQETVFEKRWHNRFRRVVNAIDDLLGITLSCAEGKFSQINCI
jgi:esterase/lipase